MKKTILLFLLVSLVTLANIKLGTASGYKDTIKVKVEVDNNIIKNITVIELNDTKRIALPAINQTISTIISTQSLEVDNIAGATYTCNGLKNAVKNALDK